MRSHLDPMPDVDGYPNMVILNNDQTFSANYFNVPEDLVVDYVDELKAFAEEEGFDVSESSSESIYGLSATWQVVDDEGHTEQREFRLNYNANGQLTLTISRNSW